MVENVFGRDKWIWYSMYVFWGCCCREMIFGDECIVFYISVEGILRMLIVCLYDLYSDKIGEWKSYFK